MVFRRPFLSLSLLPAFFFGVLHRIFLVMTSSYHLKRQRCNVRDSLLGKAGGNFTSAAKTYATSFSRCRRGQLTTCKPQDSHNPMAWNAHSAQRPTVRCSAKFHHGGVYTVVSREETTGSAGVSP